MNIVMINGGGREYGAFMAKVIIADDHALIRLGICKLFEKLPDIQIVGEASNGKEAIDLVEKHHPDVLLLDIQMPVMDGLQALEHLQKSGATVKVLVVSAYEDPHYIAEVLSHGAYGFIVKEDAPNLIVEAVRQAARGGDLGSRSAVHVRVFSQQPGVA